MWPSDSFIVLILVRRTREVLHSPHRMSIALTLYEAHGRHWERSTQEAFVSSHGFDARNGFGSTASASFFVVKGEYHLQQLRADQATQAHKLGRSSRAVERRRA